MAEKTQERINPKDKVNLTKANAKSILETIEWFYSEMQGIDSYDKDRELGNASVRFCDSLIQTILNWMGKGEVSEIESFVCDIDDIISKNDGDYNALWNMRPSAEFVAIIHVLTKFMASYIIQDNLAKHIGIICNPKRRKLKDALTTIYEDRYSAGVWCADMLVDRKIFDNMDDASLALKRLNSYGFINRYGDYFEISWSGRMIAGYLVDDNDDDVD